MTEDGTPKTYYGRWELTGLHNSTALFHRESDAGKIAESIDMGQLPLSRVGEASLATWMALAMNTSHRGEKQCLIEELIETYRHTSTAKRITNVEALFSQAFTESERPRLNIDLRGETSTSFFEPSTGTRDYFSLARSLSMLRDSDRACLSYRLITAGEKLIHQTTHYVSQATERIVHEHGIYETAWTFPYKNHYALTYTYIEDTRAREIAQRFIYKVLNMSSAISASMRRPPIERDSHALLVTALITDLSNGIKFLHDRGIGCSPHALAQFRTIYSADRTSTTSPSSDAMDDFHSHYHKRAQVFLPRTQKLITIFPNIGRCPHPSMASHRA